MSDPQTMRRLPPTLWIPLLAGVLLLCDACFIDRSGLRWSVDFEVDPTYLCPGERAEIRWDAGSVTPEDDFRVTVTRVPGGVLSTWFETPVVTGFEPMPPADPAGVRETRVSALFQRRAADDGVGAVRGLNDHVVVIGDDATHPHIERFVWGCDAAPGGGPGYGRADYGEGELASRGVQLLQIRNLSTVRAAVGLTRSLPTGSDVTTASLAPGEPSSAFAGPVWVESVLEAAPEDLDAYGPDGCGEGGPAGEVVLTEGEAPTVIVPRPEIVLELLLACAP